VRAEYLPVGYANGAFLPGTAADLVRRLHAHETELAGYLSGPSDPILFMNGGDHQLPDASMPALLDAANASQTHFRFEQVAIAEFLGRAPARDLPSCAGELRSGARANVLMGVASSRVDIKQAAAAAEWWLERVAEPLAALWLPPAEWPNEQLGEAWLAVIQNSAHDSVCGCSADPVGRVVRSRYDTAVTLAGQVFGRAVALAGLAAAGAGPVVLNPSWRDRCGVVELVLSGTDPPPEGAQVVESTAAAREERLGTGADLARILGELARDGFLGEDGRGTGADLRVDGNSVELVVRQDASRSAEPRMAAVMAEAWAQAGAARTGLLKVVAERASTQRVVARTAVPGFGWCSWQAAPLDTRPVEAGPDWLDNGRLRLVVDRRCGTFSLNGLEDFDRLVDEGDDGDTYNYSPTLLDPPVDTPEQVTVRLVEAGPVRGQLQVNRSFSWPSRLIDGRRTGSERVQVVTDLELRTGEDIVRVTTSFDNPCRDHRLRTLFALPRAANVSVAECAFGVVSRPGGRSAQGSGEPATGREFELPTFPSRRFVQAGGLTVTHQGLLEYELVDEGHALALTLLRSVGVLSKPALAYRPDRAGPPLPVPDAQLLGWHQFQYAVALGDHDPWALSDDAWTPLPVVPGSGSGHLPQSGSRLRIDGVEVSALHRKDGFLELRVFNPTGRTQVVRMPGRSGSLVDLRGRTVGRFESTFVLEPWAIATARLDALTLDEG
jgi:hypothetical protein